jgi:multidrug transporter EmrE-like cation transporter
MSGTPFSVVLLLLAGLSSAAGNLMLKQSRLGAGGEGFVASLVSPWFIAGLACYAVNVVLFAKALDRLPVAIAYPVLAGVGFALLAIGSATIFGERLSPVQLGGSGAVLFGILLLARG